MARQCRPATDIGEYRASLPALIAGPRPASPDLSEHQRGLIVAPPKAGKTMVLKTVARAIANAYPDIHLMMVLVGERPEEVTDVKRSADRGF